MDEKIYIGVDPGSKDGDFTTVTIRKGMQVDVLQGIAAEAFLQQQEQLNIARDELRDLKKQLKNLGKLVPCHTGGNFENDPPDAIIDAASRLLDQALSAIKGDE